MRHRNLPPTAVLLLGNALGGRGEGDTPQAVREPRLLVQFPSRDAPWLRGAAASGCSHPRTRSQPKKPPGPSRGCSGPSLPPPVPQTDPPRDTPALGDGFGEGAVAVPITLPLLPEPRTAPSAARGLQPAEHRLGVSSTTALPRGGEGAAGKRLPPPRRAPPAFTGTGPAAPSRGLPSSPGSSPGRQRLPARRGPVSSVR